MRRYHRQLFMTSYPWIRSSIPLPRFIHITLTVMYGAYESFCWTVPHQKFHNVVSKHHRGVQCSPSENSRGLRPSKGPVGSILKQVDLLIALFVKDSTLPLGFNSSLAPVSVVAQGFESFDSNKTFSTQPISIRDVVSFAAKRPYFFNSTLLILLM